MPVSFQEHIKEEGLGNRFLSHIREVDALIHVIRAFSNENISHVKGHTDPLRDILLIETELLLADIESLEKKGEKKYFYNLHFLTTKPCLYICNTDEVESDSFVSIMENIKKIYGHNAVLTVCASLEEQIAALNSEEDRQEFLSVLNIKEPGLNRLIKQSYRLLNLITFFTAGKKEVRAWTLSKGSAAPQAAGKIHSDFQRGFIRAEVYSFEDLKNHTSEKALKEAGKYQQEGKEYIIQDGDIIFFRFNV